jgi:hypothetical protein
MTALTASKMTPSREGNLYEYPVTAGVKCFSGGIAVLDASGYVKPGVTGTGLVTVGRFNEYVDNTGGANGAKRAAVQAGVFGYSNSPAGADNITITEIGDVVYVVDDQTVAKVATGRSVAGRVVDLDSTGLVWVKMGIGIA